ncbi:hypothetical protein HQQ94_03360 [Shewanella sp. VB17]|uniref:hypothetical protein n=1 Tax=Shewanella sp. VB17 TaxID=2739432 RepID=UPI001563091D|nr:hypothetical protein [Shewanella sp. VB17]NRD72293.1 hypothetical protein [Shewanella sp. VB17]
MFTLLRRHTLLVLTLLAMLSQGVLANTATMKVNQSHTAMMSMVHNGNIMSMQNQAMCHMEQANTSPCIDSSNCNENQPTNRLNNLVTNCCDGDGPCKSDCDHCLAISITATLFSLKSWTGYSPSEFIFITKMPHFHSISLPQDIRPPIA